MHHVMTMKHWLVQTQTIFELSIPEQTATGKGTSKIAKGESSVQRDPMFDVMPEDNIDHMEVDNAQSKGRTKEMV
ncbi:hypothetical protein Tco_0429945, partial [Tanacetum coccineum]